MDELLDSQDYTGPGEVRVTGIARDSREVNAGDAFVAIPGYQMDGHDYIPDAIREGAAAIVYEKPMDTGTVPGYHVKSSRRALSRMAAAWYDFPGNEMSITGITGTNGKTSIVYLLNSIYREARLTGGAIGTLGFMIGDDTFATDLTTPDALELHSILRRMSDRNVRMVAMEVSSHALALDRIRDIPVRIGVFTNLGRDHLDFHTTREAYRDAKGRLFRTLPDDGTAILNLDSPDYEWYASVTNGQIFTYSLENTVADFYWRSYTIDFQGGTGFLKTPEGELALHTSLLGRFNLMNVTAASAAAFAQGLAFPAIVNGIESCSSIPGRLERVSFDTDVPAIFVDYAHTPDALESALTELRTLHQQSDQAGRLWVVFGCGGDREREKRPEMGAVASSLADETVVTSDNPRSESPEQIIEEIVGGMAAPPGHIEPNRREAIKYVLSHADTEDVILIAGKGHEGYQEIQGKYYPMDDRELIRKYLDNKHSS